MNAHRLAGALAVLLALATAGCGGQAVRWDPDQRASAPPPRGATTSADSYTVRSGDTLYQIAWRHGLDWRDVAAWNDLGDGALIYPGQRLRLTAPPGGQPSRTATADSRPSAGGGGARASSSGRERPAPATRPAEPAPEWAWPVRGDLVYGFGDSGALGRGIGVGGSADQPVHAAAPGRVVYTGRGLIGYGDLVIIKHNETYLSAYGHTRSIAVTQGDEVSRGQRIAAMGEGPGQRAMLHFEIRVDGQPVDPMPLLPSR